MGYCVYPCMLNCKVSKSIDNTHLYSVSTQYSVLCVKPSREIKAIQSFFSFRRSYNTILSSPHLISYHKKAWCQTSWKYSQGMHSWWEPAVLLNPNQRRRGNWGRNRPSLLHGDFVSGTWIRLGNQHLRNCVFINFLWFLVIFLSEKDRNLCVENEKRGRDSEESRLDSF